MTSESIVVVGEASQASVPRWLDWHSRFRGTVQSAWKPAKEFLNDVSVAAVEVHAEISPSTCGEVAHAVNEKLCIFDVVALFELPKEPRRGLCAPTR
jgi:hypothetical protein